MGGLADGVCGGGACAGQLAGLQALARPRFTLLALFALVLAGSFVPWPGGAKKGPSTPGLAIQAVSGAPIRLLAPLYGKTPEQARQALTQAGITLADDEATLTSAIGKDRERLGVALKALAQGDASAPR